MLTQGKTESPINWIHFMLLTLFTGLLLFWLCYWDCLWSLDILTHLLGSMLEHAPMPTLFLPPPPPPWPPPHPSLSHQSSGLTAVFIDFVLCFVMFCMLAMRLVWTQLFWHVFVLSPATIFYFFTFSLSLLFVAGAYNCTYWYWCCICGMLKN